MSDQPAPRKLLPDDPNSIIYVSSHVYDRPSPLSGSLGATLIIVSTLILISLVALGFGFAARFK